MPALLKDHLGTVRVTVNDEGDVMGYADYYPFGMQIASRSSAGGTATKENFTGNELDTETTLLYAGARYYDPALGRWMSPDPLADDYPGWSPYNYVLNNPVIQFDPNGKYVIRGTRVVRVAAIRAQIWGALSMTGIGAPVAVAARWKRGDPSYQNSKWDKASLGIASLVGGWFKASRTLFCSVGATTENLGALDAVRRGTNFAVSGALGSKAVSDNFLVGSDETVQALAIDKAIFRVAIGLRAPDGSLLGQVGGFGTTYSISDEVTRNVFGGDEEAASTFLEGQFGQLSTIARNKVEDHNLDLSRDIDVRTLEELIRREWRDRQEDN